MAPPGAVPESGLVPGDSPEASICSILKIVFFYNNPFSSRKLWLGAVCDQKLVNSRDRARGRYGI